MRVDLILMDLMLPGMNGYEITEAIRKFEKEEKTENAVPIIAVTANTLDNDREKCFAVGMNEYLSKPFTIEELLQKVAHIIAPRLKMAIADDTQCNFPLRVSSLK